MSLIQRADLAERFRRAFGLRGSSSLGTVSDELVPVVLVEDLTGPSIDIGYPRLAFGQDQLNASVGEISEIFLVNPPDSRVDVITSQIWFRDTAGAATVILSSGLVSILALMMGAGTYGDCVNFDLRGNPAPTAYIDRRQEAATIGTVRSWLLSHSVSELTTFPLQWTIPPGHWISFTSGANNRGLEVVFWFYERLRTTD